MRTRPLVLLLSIVLATSASGQGLMADMHRDVNEVQKKFIDLAQAIPDSPTHGGPLVPALWARCCCTSRPTTI